MYGNSGYCVDTIKQECTLLHVVIKRGGVFVTELGALGVVRSACCRR